MHTIRVGSCPGYIIDLVTPTSSLLGRDRLRSAAGNCYELPTIHHKFSERAFSHASPAAWSNLPSHITMTIDTEAFKTSFKTYFFKVTFVMHLWPLDGEVLHHHLGVSSATEIRHLFTY